MDFEAWLKLVDREMMTRVGLTHLDISDKPWADWHGDGFTPEDAVYEALEAEAEEMGMESLFEE